MSTDQICAYCEHAARMHLNGIGPCSANDMGCAGHCPCPRFVANTDTETHEVMAQVLADDGACNAPVAEIYKHETEKAEQLFGGTHHVTSILPPPMPDIINHPPHYTAHPSGVECIQITEHMNFNIGNAVKYLWRAGLKGAQLDDLKKAAWYINREIERLSK